MGREFSAWRPHKADGEVAMLTEPGRQGQWTVYAEHDNRRRDREVPAQTHGQACSKLGHIVPAERLLAMDEQCQPRWRRRSSEATNHRRRAGRTRPVEEKSGERCSRKLVF
jgi:hypothetical protein